MSDERQMNLLHVFDKNTSYVGDIDSVSMRGRLLDARRTKDYALAGKAFFTVRSGATGTRFTYQVKAPEHGTEAERAARRSKPIWFVKVLIDSDNSNDLHSYKYIGLIRDSLEFHWGEKSKIGRDAPSVQAFYWFWNAAVRPEDALRFEKLEVWHEGRCGMCGRRLTVPESIASGYGPDCVERRRLL